MTATEFCKYSMDIYRKVMSEIRADMTAEEIPSEETLRKCRVKASFLLLTVKRMEKYIISGEVYTPRGLESPKLTARRIVNNTKEMVLAIVEMEAAILSKKLGKAIEDGNI